MSFVGSEEFSLKKFEERVFIIAEIGQNHQGSLELAKKMIVAAKEIGCDCVKFQKSNLNAKFTKAALSRSYINNNSWGTTYQSHKEFLEFSLDQIMQLKKFADDQKIFFSASAMDEISLKELATLNLPFIKIGSGDANNYPLLEAAAKLPIPLVLSTGMQNMSTIDEIVKIMNNHHKRNFCLLHCVSSYPTRPEDANLLTINLLQKRYPNVLIGYSGHEKYLIISQATVLLGAKVIERHITLDTSSKGIDHKCSLTPVEFKTLIKSVRKFEKKGYTGILFNSEQIEQILSREVRNFSSVEKNILQLALMKVKSKVILQCELECRRKLGKSLVYKSNLKKGNVLQMEDIVIKVSEPPGISAENLHEFIGRKLQKNVTFDEPLLDMDFLSP